MEGQDVLIIDGVYNGIGMELVAEGLFRGAELGIAALIGVDRENRRSGDTS